MKTSITHKIEAVSPTGKTTIIRHDFSIYKARSPHWDKYARAVMQPFIEALVSEGYKVRMTNLVCDN